MATQAFHKVLSKITVDELIKYKCTVIKDSSDRLRSELIKFQDRFSDDIVDSFVRSELVFYAIQLRHCNASHLTTKAFVPNFDPVPYGRLSVSSEAEFDDPEKVDSGDGDASSSAVTGVGIKPDDRRTQSESVNRVTHDDQDSTTTQTGLNDLAAFMCQFMKIQAERDSEARERESRLLQTIADRDHQARSREIEAKSAQTKILDKLVENQSLATNQTASSADKKLASLAKTFLIQMPTNSDQILNYLRSCEKLFELNSVPVGSYVKLLLPFMNHRVRRITLALEQDYYSDYHKWRKQIMSDISLTASRYRSLFHDTVRSAKETYVEFCEKLTSYLDTYLELSDVSDFESLKQLLITDKIKDGLSVEIKSVIHREVSGRRVTPQNFAMTLDSLESEKIITPSKTSRVIICSHCNRRGHAVEDCFLLQKTEKGSKSATDKQSSTTSAGSENKNSVVTCFNCKKTGHKRFECPLLAKSKASDRLQTNKTSTHHKSFNSVQSSDKSGHVNRVSIQRDMTELSTVKVTKTSDRTDDSSDSSLSLNVSDMSHSVRNDADACINAVSADLQQLPVSLPAHLSSPKTDRFVMNCGDELDVCARFDSGTDVSVFKPEHLPEKYRESMPYCWISLKGPFDADEHRVKAKLVNIAARLVNLHPTDPQPAPCILTVAVTSELKGEEALVCTADYCTLQEAAKQVIPSVSVFSCDLVPVVSQNEINNLYNFVDSSDNTAKQCEMYINTTCDVADISDDDMYANTVLCDVAVENALSVMSDRYKDAAALEIQDVDSPSSNDSVLTPSSETYGRTLAPFFAEPIPSDSGSNQADETQVAKVNSLVSKGAPSAPIDISTFIKFDEPDFAAEFRREQENDVSLKSCRDAVDNAESGYFLRENKLYHKKMVGSKEFLRLVLPAKYRQAIMTLSHESVWSSHMSARKTITRVTAVLHLAGSQEGDNYLCEVLCGLPASRTKD